MNPSEPLPKPVWIRFSCGFGGRGSDDLLQKNRSVGAGSRGYVIAWRRHGVAGTLLPTRIKCSTPSATHSINIVPMLPASVTERHEAVKR